MFSVFYGLAVGL